MQRNWIGRSDGLECDFEIVNTGQQAAFRIFTTRADTIFGATYMAVAPDHRDFEFAKKYELPIRWVIRRTDDKEVTAVAARRLVAEERSFTDYGYLFDSGPFSGMPSGQARLTIAAEAQRRGIGRPSVN